MVPSPSLAATAVLLVPAELAIDADEPFYRSRGSSATAVQNDITGILNAMDAIYNRDIGVEHQITTIIIRTVPRYTTSNPNGLLQKFRSVWNVNHAGIRRDVAHLFSGSSAVVTIGNTYVRTHRATTRMIPFIVRQCVG